MDRTRVLFLVGQDEQSRKMMPFLDPQRFHVVTDAAGAKTFEQITSFKPNLVFLEEGGSHDRRWRELAGEVRRSAPGAALILLTANGSEDLAVAALRAGLQDYLRLPVSDATLLQAVQRCLRRSPHGKQPSSSQAALEADGSIVGTNRELCEAKLVMTRAAAGDCTVLITGETGTGKELAAEYIHENSARRGKPFICVNCAAIPDSLLESELFGYAKGAFTGAQELHDGLLAAADGGTIFLDEIGDMSLFAQAKILRVLERKEVCRLGGTRFKQLNVRFVAATNQDLETMAHRGTFRRDLYFRLNVVRVELPPLRQRKDDIPLLVEYYSRYFSQRTGGSLPEFSEDCWRCLLRHDWPGNIRELKNTLENIFLGQAFEKIGPEHLPASLRVVEDAPALSSTERDLLLSALFSTQWNKSKAAAKLCWSRMTLYRKMAKYNISRLSSPTGPGGNVT